MFDLQLLAMQGDVTRVMTFQLARETSNRTYPEIGVPDPHHPLSHHGNDPDKIARMAKINAFHVSLFAEYLQKLDATPDGEGSLLDHSLILYGSGMGDPNKHDHTNLPILVAGGAAAGVKGNRHIQYNEVTPLANLHLTLHLNLHLNIHLNFQLNLHLNLQLNLHPNLHLTLHLNLQLNLHLNLQLNLHLDVDLAPGVEGCKSINQLFN